MAAKFNPFTPGTGHTPPLLAGREDATETLTQMMELLDGPRTWREKKLKRSPFPPIRIVGPRGVGKTTLLSWAEVQAQKKKIHTVRCAYLDDSNETDDPMRHLLTAMSEGSPQLLKRIRELSLEIPVTGGGFGVKTDPPDSSYSHLVRGIVAKDPLLLLLDEVHHYSLRSLSQLLQINQELISQGYPLGMVLAGTPGLNSYLNKTKSTFVARSKSIYVHSLSDEATRAALRVPLEKDGLKVAPDALEAMAAQTDNYPYFIQLVGAEVWNAVQKACRKNVELEQVSQAENKAREQRIEIYEWAYRRIVDNSLLKQANQVMTLLENKGGAVEEDDIIKTLIESNPGVEEARAYEICDSLREDAFIWTVRGITKPGISSFFNYFKEKRKKQE